MATAARTMQEQKKVVTGEHRWPMALAVLTAIVLSALVVPESFRHGPSWLVPLGEAVLLVVLIIGDPGRIDRRSQTLRIASIGLVSILLLSALMFTAQLVSDLVHGGPETNSADELLRAGAAVWVSNNIAFALFYWELDGGGSAVRAHAARPRLDLAFPQQLSPDVGWGDWRPLFVDYFYLGFTSAMAFSPTDVMPLAPWAKMAMLVQSLASLATLSLVIARAVNIFS